MSGVSTPAASGLNVHPACFHRLTVLKFPPRSSTRATPPGSAVLLHRRLLAARFRRDRTVPWRPVNIVSALDSALATCTPVLVVSSVTSMTSMTSANPPDSPGRQRQARLQRRRTQAASRVTKARRAPGRPRR